jgi:hypothetical protein
MPSAATSRCRIGCSLQPRSHLGHHYSRCRAGQRNIFRRHRRRYTFEAFTRDVYDPALNQFYIQRVSITRLQLTADGPPQTDMRAVTVIRASDSTTTIYTGDKRRCPDFGFPPDHRDELRSEYDYSASPPTARASTRTTRAIVSTGASLSIRPAGRTSQLPGALRHCDLPRWDGRLRRRQRFFRVGNRSRSAPDRSVPMCGAML